ncbi:hypothetical protein TEQG_00048 [Trichophyton equinum CBS 127.97]|uniref:Uncharacterized protein n=1 Tax=Trichophyton equinum (strain ATCC MYA-4606 / CBS 127.97) TaxID=559882 RepID=F2PGH6_TRIEC|nr:hypothetical protein TEQG_00048 [Trichophyton equinum CBS 127.97]
MAENCEEPDQYGSMSLDPPDGPEYSASGRYSEDIEESDSIMEESGSDTIGRSALGKEFWTRIGESLDIPWHEAEAMHFELGEEELSSRAGDTAQHPTINDMITNVQKDIDHLSGLLHLLTDEPYEELTYSRLLHALARASTSAATVTKHIDENLGTWKARDIASMDEIERHELVPSVVNFTMTERDDQYVLVPETAGMTLEIRK